nr:MAG TPA: hypothetical protein [Microviridae sp.]
MVRPHSPGAAWTFYIGIIRERPHLGPFLQSVQILYLPILVRIELME